jgi:tetratricopeptide (TPR) repeat protein
VSVRDDIDRFEDLASLEALVLADSSDTFARFELAQALAHQDPPSRAIQLCEEALRQDPDFNPALSLWSKLLFERGDHITAIDALEAARARQGELPEAMRIGYALHLDAAGRWEESSSEFERIESPVSAKVYHVLRGDEFLGASELARAALDAEPSSPSSHVNWGITQLYEGGPDQARAAFLRALDLDAQQASALYNLAIVDTFYYYDEEQGREWFDRYRATGASDDPDSLSEIFATLGGANREQARR